MSRQMKESNIGWIGEIPQSWGINTAFQIFTQVKNKNSDLQERNLLSLSYGKIKRKDIETTDGLLPESFDGYNIIEAGDIVLRLTDLQNDQKSLRVGLATERGIVTSAYITLRNRSQALPEFLYYYLHAFDISKGFYGMGAGVRQGLNWDGLKWLKILNPTADEQKQIVNYLDNKCVEIDRTIAETEKTIEEYKALKQSIITEAVTHGVRGDRPMKDSGIEWIGQIPDDWLLIKGKYLFKERNQRGNSKELQLLSPTQKYGVIPQKLYEELSGMKAVKLEETVDLASLKSIYTGDFCISLRSFQGGFEYSRYNGVVSPAYHVFFAKTPVYTDYFMYLFKEFGFINKMASLTKTFRDGKSISFDDFSNSLIPYPPIETQKEISSYLSSKCDEIEGLIDSKQHFLKEIENYKKSLIYEYVTGKKEVI